MGCLERILILLLSISGILSDTNSGSIGTRELLNEDLLASGKTFARHVRASPDCVVTCERHHHRECLDDQLPMPLACGTCLPGYSEHRVRDGMWACLPDQRQQNRVEKPEEDINRLVDMLESQRQRQAEQSQINAGNQHIHQKDDGLNFMAQKKDKVAMREENAIEDEPAVAQPQVQEEPESDDTADSSIEHVWLIAVVAGCSVAGVVGLIVAGVCWYRLQKNVKAASEAEYSAYGVTGPQQEGHIASPGDRKLAQSAQMYHYQHQKQQMLALEKANGDMTKDDDGDSEEENEEGDYTVYECPGLAPTGEMEVKNPLFSEDTPVTPSDGREERK